MVMSRGPGCKFRNLYSLPNSILDFRKVTKFGGNWLKNKKLQAKSKTRGGTPPPPPVLIGLKGINLKFGGGVNSETLISYFMSILSNKINLIKIKRFYVIFY